MATFPHNLCDIRQDGHAEQHQPIMLRTEMERGVARQRRQSADSRISVPCTLVFRSAADAAAFETWFYGDAQAGAAWFDFTLPRTGTVVQARIIGGDIGALSPITPAWNASERSIVLEYIRPNFIQLAPGSYDIDASRILSVQRASTATYIDDDGVLQTAAANVARYQGGRLLVEGAATNYAINNNNNNSSTPYKYTSGDADGNIAVVVDPFWGLVLRITKTVGAAGARVGARWSVGAVTGSSFTAAIWIRRPASVTSGMAVYCDMLKAGGGIRTVSLALNSIAADTFVRASSSGSEVGASFVGGSVYAWVDGAVGDYIDVALPCVWPGLSDSSAIVTAATPATRAADLITVAA